MTEEEDVHIVPMDLSDLDKKEIDINSKEVDDQTDQTIEFIVTFPIFKPFRRINLSFRRSVEKKLKKLNPWFRPKHKPVVAELNQFLFCSTITENPRYLDISNRVGLEDAIDNIYSKFSSKILKQLKSNYTNDPELKNSISAFKDANSYFDNLIKDDLNRIQSLPHVIVKEIERIFKNGSLIIWDLPGKNIDRIIAGYEKINREDDSIEEANIGAVSDELTLATFGKQHVPLLINQVQRITNSLSELVRKVEEFNKGFVSFKDEQEKEVLSEVGSVFLGKVLGIREPLILAERQLYRYLDLEDELKEEGEKINSTFLTDIYKQFINSEETKQAIRSLDVILETISDNGETIRELLVNIDNAKVDGNSSPVIKEFLEFTSKLYYDMEEFRFITETFQDIPAFTAMGGGIAVEGLETEKTEVPENAIIYMKDIFKTFPMINSTVYALRGVDLTINKGEFVAIMGPSGSGKTTLLNIMSGLDKPDRGTVISDGLDLVSAKEGDLINYRREKVSFIYQSYNLLPVLKNIENVTLPADLGINKDLGKKKVRGKELLNEVGLGDYIKGSPLTLSGGQQQRVTIARAFMNKPSILFCDEPTGDLDSKTGMQVMDIIDGFHQDGATIVLVTHDEAVAKRAQRTIRMQDGKVVSSKNK